MTDFRDYGPLILTCLSQMPRFPSIAQHFFELYDFGSGLTSDELYPPSIGLSFFSWVCLDQLPFQAELQICVSRKIVKNENLWKISKLKKSKKSKFTQFLENLKTFIFFFLKISKLLFFFFENL